MDSHPHYDGLVAASKGLTFSAATATESGSGRFFRSVGDAPACC